MTITMKEDIIILKVTNEEKHSFDCHLNYKFIYKEIFYNYN